MRRRLALSLMLVALPLPVAAQAAGSGARAATPMVTVPAGSFQPVYRMDGDVVRVASFRMDRLPVTRAQFAEFVAANPRWRRDRVAAVFAGPAYLRDWPSATSPGTGDDALRPVVNVSWFAAKSYCEWRGARLPRTDEWELVARADTRRRDASADADFRREILEKYTRPRIGLPAPVGEGMRNVYGIGDLHDGVWEWVLDFGASFKSADSRSTGGRDRGLFCAAGANAAVDPNDYAAFLRYSFRSTLSGSSAIQALGFRCVADIGRTS